jgi:hypothetical protein
MMVSLKTEFAYLEKGLEELESYLLSEVLFWPLSGSPPDGGQAFQRLTLGGLYLALALVSAHRLDRTHQHEFSKINRQLDHLHHKWRAAWVRKASWEFRSRLKQWENYLNELRRNSGENSAFYHYEVRTRVMLHFLKPEAEDIDRAFIELLESLDKLLEVLLKQDGFIWNKELSEGFPKDVFWYLWGEIREESIGFYPR